MSDNTNTASTKKQDGPSQTLRAATALRDMVMNNELAAGSNYLESELADMLDMSRTPIREAVLILEGQGLVEVRPRRGIRVLPLSTADMAETYEVLTALELVAVEKAAKRGLDENELMLFERILDEMDSALETDDRDAWAEADRRFHDELVALAGNQRIIQIVATMNDQVHRARLLTLRLRPTPTQSNLEHRDLFRSIARGEATAACAVHSEHRARAKDMIISLLETYGFHQI